MKEQAIRKRRRWRVGATARLAGLAMAGALVLIPADVYGKDSKTISQKSSSGSKASSGSSSGSSSSGGSSGSSRGSAGSSYTAGSSRSGGSAHSGSRASSKPERRTLFGRREAQRPVQQGGSEQPPTTATGSTQGGSSSTSSSGSRYGRGGHGYYGHGYYGHGYYGHGHYYPYYRHRFSYYPYFYGPYGRHYPYRSYREETGALDLNVKPKKTRVYIDGTPIGPVDRYDGFPSYLWLEAGTYELSFYLEGHETLHRTYTVYPGVIVDVDERMQTGVAVEPEPPAPAADRPGESRYGSYGESRDVEVAPRDRPTNDDAVGRLQLRVEPGDAAVYLDGHFLGTGEELSQLSAGLVVEPGRHVLELVRPGYQSREVPITIAVGKRLELDFELERR